MSGYPKDLEEANAWIDNVNSKKTESEPQWSFDCGFKLDFDGELVGISSRFYPPKAPYGPKWDGTVSVFVLGDQVIEEKFECDTLDELKTKVEEFVGQLATAISLQLVSNRDLRG